MPIKGQGWEFHVQRTGQQQHADGKTVRTIGTYQLFHDGVAVDTASVDGVDVALHGTTAESKGPGQNDHPATEQKPSRILPGRYPLMTAGGPEYVTNHYRPDLKILNGMPGIELMETGNRFAIIVHPGKNAFLSSIGCINPCTSLPDAAELIDYAGSRRRVIALIEDMRAFLHVPETGDTPIPGAWIVIDGEP